VFRGGTITTGSTIHQGSHIVKSVDETGLGNRLTIGLDETARTMVICDAGDVDTDLGLGAKSDPTLFLFKADGTDSLFIDHESFYSSSSLYLQAVGNLSFIADGPTSFLLGDDIFLGDVFTFTSGASDQLRDTDGEQSWLYIEPKINQSSTAAYNGLKVNAIETVEGTSIGDGSTGDGNLLLNLQRNSSTMMSVDRTGIGYFAGALTAASYADNTPYFEGDALTEILKIKGKDGEIDHKSLPDFAYVERVENIKTVDPKTEVTKEEAIGTVQVDERVMYEEEVIEKKKVTKPKIEIIDGEEVETTEVTYEDVVKKVKKPKVLETKIIGYELVDGEPVAKTENIYETKKVNKKELKEGYEFDTTDGKFYKLGKVTNTETVKEGRDLGAMISMLTVAVQQLTERVEALEKQ